MIVVTIIWLTYDSHDCLNHIYGYSKHVYEHEKALQKVVSEKLLTKVCRLIRN